MFNIAALLPELFEKQFTIADAPPVLQRVKNTKTARRSNSYSKQKPVVTSTVSVAPSTSQHFPIVVEELYTPPKPTATVGPVKKPRAPSRSTSPKDTQKGTKAPRKPYTKRSPKTKSLNSSPQSQLGMSPQLQQPGYPVPFPSAPQFPYDPMMFMNPLMLSQVVSYNQAVQQMQYTNAMNKAALM